MASWCSAARWTARTTLCGSRTRCGAFLTFWTCAIFCTCPARSRRIRRKQCRPSGRRPDPEMLERQRRRLANRLLQPARSSGRPKPEGILQANDWQCPVASRRVREPWCVVSRAEPKSDSPDPNHSHHFALVIDQHFHRLIAEPLVDREHRGVLGIVVGEDAI